MKIAASYLAYYERMNQDLTIEQRLVELWIVLVEMIHPNARVCKDHLDCLGRLRGPASKFGMVPPNAASRFETSNEISVCSAFRIRAVFS